jgi:RNA-directed DNA polymerase
MLCRVLDALWTRHHAHLGIVVRYADDFVVMCDTKAQVEAAEQGVRQILTRLGLERHPEKTRQVDLSDGGEGFDCLGCHLRKRMSGPIWEKRRQRVYFLHQWPSARAMRPGQVRVRELTPRAVCHGDVRDTLARLNPVLRGWGSYVRTTHAATKFIQVD